MKTKSSKPQTIAAETHVQAKNRANSFIKKIGRTTDGRFSRLWMRAFSNEYSFIDGNSHVDRKDTEILINVVLKMPRTQKSVKQTFKGLIEWMEQAGHRCEVTPINPSTAGRTANYELAFVQESTYSRKTPAKTKVNRNGTSDIKWSGDYLAMTETKTAEICRGHPKASKDYYKNNYSILVFDHNSRFLEVLTANTLKEARKKVKVKLSA